MACRGRNALPPLSHSAIFEGLAHNSIGRETTDLRNVCLSIMAVNTWALSLSLQMNDERMN
jgi:hypothetical protein